MGLRRRKPASVAAKDEARRREAERENKCGSVGGAGRGAASRGQCEIKEDELAEGRCCPTGCVLTGLSRPRRSDRPRGTAVGKSRRAILEWTRMGPGGGTGLGQAAGPSGRWDDSRAQAHVAWEMGRAQGAGAASPQTAPESTVEQATSEGGERRCLRLEERQEGVAQLLAVFGGPLGCRTSVSSRRFS